MAKKEEKTNSTEKLVEVVIDGQKFMLSESEAKEFENFETEKKSEKNGTNISDFKSTDARHKWQKYIKKHLPTFAKVANASTEKLQKIFANSLKSEFDIFVAKFNEYHVKEINLSNEITESMLRNINAANVSQEMIDATNEKVIKGLNICRNEKK